jgi:hypothetical protein
MFGQQNILKKTFDKYGWELVETQISTDWWIAEIWLIKSTWSPTDCYVFLSFRVDEELEDKTKRNFNVWSIKLSLNQPLQWQNDNFGIDTSDDFYEEILIKRNFEKRIIEFFEELAKLRARYNKQRQ